MSSPASHATQPAGSAAQPTLRRPLPGWLREPLLHFAVLGALVFAADHVVSERAGDPRTIVVGKAVVDEASTLFRQSRGRAPNADELRALTERWLDNEVLYREGLALQVDQGDTMIRDRVIFKSLMVVESGLQRPQPDDATLRKWFESRRAQYDEPARYDFHEAVLAGSASEAEVRAFAQALNNGAPGEAKAGLRVFKGRPQASLAQSYGNDFAPTLAQGPVGEWRAVATRDGWRALRLDAVTAPQPASFEALRNAVLPDWTDATLAQARTDAVRARAKKYAVRYEGSAP